MQHPTITTPPEIIAVGVSLLPALHPDAINHLHQIAGADLDAVQELIPFAAVLLNGSHKEISMTAVLYTWTGADHRPAGALFTLRSAEFGSGLKPGEAQAFFPQRGLNVYFAHKARPGFPALKGKDGDPESITATMVSEMSGARDIKTTIDGISFVDRPNLVIGPNMGRN